MKESDEYVLEEAEGGIEGSCCESDRDLLLFSDEVDMVNFGFVGREPTCSRGCPCEPIGVASDSFGAPSLDARLNLGTPPAFSASGGTGL